MGSSCSNGLGRSIDSQHRARRTDQFGEQKSDISGTAADVEDLHASSDTCGLQKRARDPSEIGSLVLETLKLTPRMTTCIERLRTQSISSHVCPTRSWPKLWWGFSRTRQKPALS